MFQFVQILYWLALSTWFGGALFVTISAAVIFRTVREYNPMLPTVLSVNLENQHATLLSSSIVANLLAMLVRIEIPCAVVLFITIGLQWLYIDRHGVPLVEAILRSTLFVAAVGLMLYNSRIVWPKVQKFRQEYLDHADEPDVANPAIDQFERYDRESFSILRNLIFLLLGMILFSGDIRVVTQTFIFQ
jgi:hypothetical protein